jgi:hypothetical protein
MQVRFTVYNCGTGYNRDNNDVVAQLNRETVSLHMINDGPGGGSLLSGNPGGATKLAGLVGGKGVDANVASAVEEIRRRKLPSTVVNMCGWSRGAVTCFKIARVLFDDPETRNIAVNIFAIDPVPGGSALNNHMWKGIDVASNVRMCRVILSQHDRRGLFAPVFPPVSSMFTDVDLMPGDHSTIVEPHASRVEAYELVKDMAKRFLWARGTVFSGPGLLSPREVLERYARIAETFDDYAHYAKGAPSKLEKRFQGERPLRDVTRKVVGKILPTKPAFFMNEHHRETSMGLYPNLTREIDLAPAQAFSDQKRAAWMPEFDRMTAEAPLHAKVTLFYILACQRTPGR